MPSSGNEMVTIRVSDKVLYIGHGTAYPLAGIVRVRWDRIEIDTSRYVRAIVGNVALFLIVWFVVTGIERLIAGSSTGSSPAGLMWIVFAALLFFGIRSLEPIRMLRQAQHPYYALRIDTAGSVGSRLINPDEASLAKVGRQIIDAIDNPAAEWQMQVNHYHVGDTIHQTGPESIGKVTV